MSTALQPIPLAPVPRLALRLQEASEAISVSDRKLHEWAKAGIVPSVVIGGVRLFPVDAIRVWLTERAAKSAPQEAEKLRRVKPAHVPPSGNGTGEHQLPQMEN